MNMFRLLVRVFTIPPTGLSTTPSPTTSARVTAATANMPPAVSSAVSAAWNISNEAFLHDSSTWLDQLKLRASFGQQGNDGIGNNYAYLDQYQITGETDWSDGKLVYKGNKDLTWETSNSFNVGVDFSFWKSKLSGTVEYFSRQTSDMLYNRPTAISTRANLCISSIW